MDLEEYKEWVKENGNKEEVCAIEVIDEILKYHIELNDAKFESIEVLPHKVIVREKERLEFDLIIKLKHSKSFYDRLIGVEFKEYDIQKVVRQAVRRREFVDYMYIATRSVAMDYPEIFLLTYFGIGWVVYFEDFAKMIVPARYQDPSHIFERVVDEALKAFAEKKLKNLTLNDFIGGRF